jgi:ferric-dicitrate binding protein FerR (iron transport regulator)
VESTSAGSPSIILDPDEKAIYDKPKDLLTKSSLNQRKELAWKDKILVFDGSSYGEIKKILERWYGVQIIVEDQSIVKDWQFTGRFQNPILENVLTNIVFAKELDFRIDNDSVKIYRRTKNNK